MSYVLHNIPKKYAIYSRKCRKKKNVVYNNFCKIMFQNTTQLIKFLAVTNVLLSVAKILKYHGSLPIIINRYRQALINDNKYHTKIQTVSNRLLHSITEGYQWSPVSQHRLTQLLVLRRIPPFIAIG